MTPGEASTPSKLDRGRDIGVAALILVGMLTIFLAPPIGWALVLIAAVFAVVGPFGLSRTNRAALVVFSGAGVLTIALLALFLLPAGVSP